MSVSSATGSSGLVDTNATAGSVVITNFSFDSPPDGFTVSALNANKAEGNSGTTSFTFTVTRSTNLGQAASQDWFVFGTGNTPASGSDFAGGVYPTGEVHFAIGETSKTVTILVNRDTRAETNENFFFSLTNNYVVYGAPQNVPSPPDYMALGTIQNDDAAVTTTYNLVAGSNFYEYLGGPQAVSLSEGNFGSGPFATFTVWRNGDISQAGSVDWVLTGNGANPLDPADFANGILPSGTVIFGAGQNAVTFSVAWNGDFLPEADETGLITLSNPVGGVLDNATANLTLTNDDIPTQSGTGGGDRITVDPAYPYSLVDLSQGGSDNVTGSSLDDVFLLGAALNPGDSINGGDGFDQVVLDGDYSAGIILGKNTITNVATVILSPGHDYKITTHDNTVANGASITFDASALAPINAVTINAAAEKSATVIFLGGAGNDVFTGGKGADVFVGNAGADTETGGKGADLFQYLRVGDSPLETFSGLIDTRNDDTLVNFVGGTDVIDLTGLLIPLGAQSVVTQSTSGFSANLANGAGYFGSAGVAVEYSANGNSVAARVYVDANHDGNLGSGDMLIQITGVRSGSLGGSSFHF